MSATDKYQSQILFKNSCKRKEDNKQNNIFIGNKSIPESPAERTDQNSKLPQRKEFMDIKKQIKDINNHINQI